ncbi:RadC family protein [Candidatus Saccharibacteria bacterium]|nr:RadC family protein [Candidatus Saccharibacteria bacterium]
MEYSISYDRPREKLQKKGAAALTNAELLQILIGSGTAQASVTRIARKVLKQLSQYGNAISHTLLLEVTGLGPARASQIVAAFELAGRYPVSNKQLTIDSNEKARGLFVELTLAQSPRLVYLTLDGARRLIAKRSIRITDSSHPSGLLRTIFSHVVTDQAAGVVIAIGAAKHTLDPSMFELSLARDLNGMAQLFIVTVHDLLLVNKQSERSLKGESW